MDLIKESLGPCGAQGVVWGAFTVAVLVTVVWFIAQARYQYRLRKSLDKVMSAQVTVTITKENFEQLVRGEMLETAEHSNGLKVRIYLQDIGFGPMITAIREAQSEVYHGK